MEEDDDNKSIETTKSITYQNVCNRWKDWGKCDKQQSNDEDKDVKFLLDQFETLIQSNWKCQIPNWN
jgi:hypothetical protein